MNLKMLKLKEMEQEKEVKDAYEKFTGYNILPPFLFEKPENQRVVLGCFYEEYLIGLMFGVVEEETNCFFLHHISIDKNFTKKSILLWFTKAVFKWLLKYYQIEKAMIEIRQAEDKESFFISYLREVESFRIAEVCYVYQAGLPTEKFAELRKKHWYCPWLLEEKGYEAIPVEECGTEEWQKVKEAEEAGQQEKDYLSPGFWEKNMTYDKVTSFALVKQGTKTPLGWIITEKKEDAVVLLRRFYIYKEERKKRLGPAFSTWVLDEIEKHYQYLRYEVVKGNRQMEMFLRCYCKPYLLEDDCKCKIILEREEKKSEPEMQDI